MKTALFKKSSQTVALVSSLCVATIFAGSVTWLAGCSGGSGGSGISLGNGLPTGGGDGPGNGGGGNGGGGGGTIPTPVPECGGGSLEATFSAPVATNANTAVFAATKVQGAALNAGAGASSFNFVGSLCSPPATGNRLVNIKVSQPLVAGTTYTLSSGSSGGNFLQYIESTVVDEQTVEKSWTATAATLTVQSVTGQTVTFRIENASLSPDPDFFTSNATGTFNLNVMGTVTAVNGL